MSTAPRIIPVGEEPPPLEGPGQDRRQDRGAARSKPKGRRGKGERFAVLNTFADFTLRELERNEIAVWLVLWRDSRDGIARTGQADIGRRIGATARTVRRVLGQLQRRGLVDIVRRGGRDSGPSRYRLRGLSCE